MAPEQAIEIVRILEDSRQEFLNCTAGLSEAHAAAKQGPDRWSVLECAEHVVVVEERFLGRVKEAPRAEAPRIDKKKEADLKVAVANRANRGEAPEPVRPAGRFLTLAQALEAFQAIRAESIRFAEQRHADLGYLALEHPRFGALNGAEYLVLIAGHSSRHADQIREVREVLGIPSIKAA